MDVALYIIIGVAAGAGLTFGLMHHTLGEALKRLRARTEELERENSKLSAERHTYAARASLAEEQAGREAQLREEKFAEQLRAAQAQMESLSQRLFRQQAERLGTENSRTLEQATQPLRQAIGEMRKEMVQGRESAAANTAAFREQMAHLIESSDRVGQQANHLAQALRGDVKAQGNWGEVVLGNLLEAEHLQEGRDYDLQVRLRDRLGRSKQNADSGAAMQPDAIIHYPQQQDVIVDAKVSLKAYDDFLRAETDEARGQAVAALVESLREQYRRLSKKDYGVYIEPPRRTLDYVIMFVPNEAALQLALESEPGLWREAFDRKVLIAGERNLTAVLRTIQIVWRQYVQAENQQRVFQVADRLLDRLGLFLKRYAELGNQIERLQRGYADAGRTLSEGRTSVLRAGDELRQLGAKDNPNHPLPELPAD